MPASSAVAGGVQDRKAVGDMPSTLADPPLMVTTPPSTGMTARTPGSAATWATWAAANPLGSVATRSGTTSWLGAGPRTPATDVPVVPGSGEDAAAGLAALPTRAEAARSAPVAGPGRAWPPSEENAITMAKASEALARIPTALRSSTDVTVPLRRPAGPPGPVGPTSLVVSSWTLHRAARPSRISCAVPLGRAKTQHGY